MTWWRDPHAMRGGVPICGRKLLDSVGLGDGELYPRPSSVAVNAELDEGAGNPLDRILSSGENNRGHGKAEGGHRWRNSIS